MQFISAPFRLFPAHTHGNGSLLMNKNTAGAMTARANGSSMQVITIGDREIAFARSGSGLPTVVLETGLGAESAEWAAVERGVSTVARVFRYDRAGRGMSAPATVPRDAHMIVDELHRLLRMAGLPSPYVLVGQ